MFWMGPKWKPALLQLWLIWHLDGEAGNSGVWLGGGWPMNPVPCSVSLELLPAAFAQGLSSQINTLQGDLWSASGLWVIFFRPSISISIILTIG